MSDDYAPPLVDPRSADEVARQLRKLLAVYAPQWGEYEPKPKPKPTEPAAATPETTETTTPLTPKEKVRKAAEAKERAAVAAAASGHAKGLSGALVGIFVRYVELIIQRLNKTPEKNLLAFLDMLGISILPPQPARVPLTFFLASGSLTDGIVPAGTQVAAPPAEGASEPVVFETERELTVVAASLTNAFTRDPSTDTYEDHGAITRGTVEAGARLFHADTPAEHVLYISHERFLSHPALRELRISFDLWRNIEKPEPRSLSWELWDGTRWVEIVRKPSGATPTPGPTGFVEDATAALTTSGDVVLTGLKPLPPRAVGGSGEARWLRCRLATPIPPAKFKQKGTEPAQLPTVTSITLKAKLQRPPATGATGESLTLEAAFLNYAPVDTTKDFFPFGEKPQLGDALYLAQSEAFSTAPGATVTLDFTVTLPETNPANDEKFPKPQVTHAWEFWDGKSWALLFKSDRVAGILAAPGVGGVFTDETQAFTKSGKVTFTLPRRVVRTNVNGVDNFWVRVRIVAGNYGREAFYKLKPKDPAVKPPPPDEYVVVPATYAPPTVGAVAVGYSVTESEPPERVVVYNNFTYEPKGTRESFEPFKTADETNVTLYLGFTLPEGRRKFPNRVVGLYVGLVDYFYGGRKKADAGSQVSSPRLVWQYWDGLSWSRLTVIDGTADLTRKGLLEFLAPADFTPRTEFGSRGYWVRVQLAGGGYRFEPRARALLLNTTTAAQTETLRDETLGSSDASAGQKFLTTASPVLTGQRLEVREPDLPPAGERAVTEAEEGSDAFAVTLDDTGRPLEIWVRWHEVADFYASGPRDRHYVLDHLTGEVHFGNGQSGMIPPRGASNLRMKFYKTGGGTAGNRPAGTITELKTTVPYIDSVSNLVPAAGGADAESYESMTGRGPRTIRHHDRAVTAQDYEDLALMASPGVARVKCVPLQDLSESVVPTKVKHGKVSLIVVPLSKDPRPTPDLTLIDTVRAYLDRRRAADGELIIVGPEYVSVKVEAEVVPESASVAGRLEERVLDALSRFLHPLTGGGEGEGWAFGRRPHLSDIYGVIEAVPGVAYVRSLRLSATTTDDEGLEQPLDFNDPRPVAGHFLVHSGEHEISLVFDKETLAR